MLEDLKTKHRKVARLSFEGLEAADISKQTGVGVQTVYKILRDPICKAYIRGLHDKLDDTTLDVRARLMKLNSKALDRFEDILDADSKAPYSVQASVSKDILDRTGNKAPDKIDINHTMQNKTDAEIEAQINAISAQLEQLHANDLSPEDETDFEASDASSTFINPKTDCRESK